MNRYSFLDLASSASVRAAQAQMGVDHLWTPGQVDRQMEAFTADERAFIAARDSFYMASVSETGWPYVQYRGGPPGFLKVIDETTLAFADFRGNRQYISVGNLDANDRVALILVDYPRRARLKILAHAERLALDADPALLAQVSEPGYRAKPDAGESVLQLATTPVPGAPPAPLLPPKNGFIQVDPARFASAFAADVDPAVTHFMAASQVPWGLGAVGAKITAPAWKAKPSYYLLATHDLMIPPAAQRAMAVRAKATLVETPSSHAVMLSKPDHVADFIEMAADETQ